MKRYSAEELRALGFSEDQIQAIVGTYKREIKDIPASPLLEKVVPIEPNARDIVSSSLMKVTTVDDYSIVNNI